MFTIGGKTHALHQHGGLDNAYVHVNMINQKDMLEMLQDSCSQVASNLCAKFRFPYVKIMATLGMVMYLQYWVCEKVVAQKLSPTSS